MALRDRARRTEIAPEVVERFVHVCAQGALDAELVVLASKSGGAHACYPPDERARANEVAALLARLLRANSGPSQAALGQVIQVVGDQIQVFQACRAVSGCWIVAIYGTNGTNLGLALSQVNRANKTFTLTDES